MAGLADVRPSNLLVEQEKITPYDTSGTIFRRESKPTTVPNFLGGNEAAMDDIARQIPSSAQNNSDSEPAASLCSSAPYKRHVIRCDKLECSRRTFSDRASLLRHQREVHRISSSSSKLPPPSYPCPVRGCRRHDNAFARQWNLQEHMKRVHGQHQKTEIPSNHSKTPLTIIKSRNSDVVRPKLPTRVSPSLLPKVSEEMGVKGVLGILEANLAALEKEKGILEDKIRAIGTAIQSLKDLNIEGQMWKE